jgi:two-component system, NarL family, invasion response regulator UvrY
MITLLLADDHQLFREGLKQIFKHEPDLSVVAEASSGPEVLTALRNTSCDLVLLDISMPGQSGWDALAEIRNEWPGQKVLILSMHPEDQYAVRMLKAGAAGYIGKEAAPEELIGAIRRVAAGGRYVSTALGEKLAFTIDHDARTSPHETLSNREFQVMLRLAAGKTLKEIADEMSLSEKTITTYRARILEKLDVRNNVELTRYAIANRLIPDGRL